MADQNDLREELLRHRDTLDTLDRRLVEVLAERFAVTERIGEIKARLDLPALDAERERAQRERLRELSARVGVDAECVQNVFETVTSAVRRRHEEIRSVTRSPVRPPSRPRD
ncbi:MAG: chorismate mutase [Spirochaetales bacterium]|nr:chorismate mutase [Spirochaetales bacterium]